ncbi:MAG: hypothetical protein HUU15_03460 [Candidatus Brocadiae bacterium]|nr:hypothetical protein [Candidatus Brocadiia bacterium]
MRAPLASLSALLLVLPCLAQEPAAAPGRRIRDRAAVDGKVLFPQRGLGGGDANPVQMGPADFSELAIGEPGCESMTGYMSLPKGLDRSKRYALLFVFHGNGDRGKGRVGVLARVTTERDPVIVIGVQYQELQADGSGKMGLPTLAKPDVILKGCRWLLEKTMKEQPVDPERVFVGGFSWGTAWTSGWATSWWKEDPEGFPFRALFLYSSGGAGSKSTLPPVPTVCMVGELETKEAGNYDVLPSVRHYSNVLAHWGFPVLHHEIPGMGHDVNARCIQITRDVIQDLGGPGSLPYPSPGGIADPGPEPLGFAKNEDRYVQEILALLADDRWPDAIGRIAAIELDRKITLADKRAVLAFRTEMQKFAQAELPRLDRLLSETARAGGIPGRFQLRRQRALLEAYSRWPWAQKKQYAETIAIFDGDYPPTLREAKRRHAMLTAWTLELSGCRDDAKPLYEELVAAEQEDGGVSPWPAAAKYRLKWWTALRE